MALPKMESIDYLVLNLLRKPKSVFAVVSYNEERVFYLGQSRKEADDVMKGCNRKCTLQKYEPLENGSVAQTDYTPPERTIGLGSVHWDGIHRGTYHNPEVIKNILQKLYSKLDKKTD